MKNILIFTVFSIVSFSLSSMQTQNRINREKELIQNRADVQIIGRSEDNKTLNVKFLGPDNSQFNQWYEIEVEFVTGYPFKAASIIFVGERPKHKFYWEVDNLSKNQDFGLFVPWSPQIRLGEMIDMIKDSLINPTIYEHKMATGMVPDLN